jgi:hypothetical protein
MDSVTYGVASLHRCTPAGRVLNQRLQGDGLERMQADWKLISSG